MPENFIVTVSNHQGTLEIDLQIPARLKVAEFSDKLLQILKILDEQEFRRWARVQLNFNGRALRGNETLASAGVFDGSRITVAEM